MSGAFDFPIRNRDLRRVDALRLDLGSDFWPEAAFAVFRSAMIANAAAPISIPAAIRAKAILGAKSRGYAKVLPCATRVRQERPCAEVVAFLGRLAASYRMTPRSMATALVAAWAADPECWPGAPRIGGAA